MHSTPDPYTAPDQHTGAVPIRQRFGYWLPLASCIALSLLTSAGNAYSQSQGRDKNDITFLFIGFMPMCFASVCAHFYTLHNEIRQLRSQIHSTQSSVPDQERSIPIG